MINKEKLRTTIRTIMHHQGLNHEEFGRSIGVSKMMISYVLSGKRNLRLKNVQKLCDVWGIEIQSLMEFGQKRRKPTIAEALNEVLRIQKIKPDDIADSTGMNLLTINQILRGIKSPTEEELEKLADVLQIEKAVLEEGALLVAFNDMRAIMERIQIPEEAIDAVMKFLEREIQNRRASM